ncbi:MAG: MFS transporter [Thermoanaerobaculia bacterium]
MDSQRVIRTYLLISGLFTLAGSLIWGINTLFLLDAGLTIFEVFLANAAFTGAMALFEIPTGVVADTRGRRMSFLLAGATLAIGTLAYVGAAYIHGGLLLFILAGAILGLGFAFYSGAVEAWVVDALKETGYERELDSVFARAGAVNGVAMVIGTVGGGLLGQLDLALPYLVRAALLMGAFAVGFRWMHDLGFQPRALRLSGMVGEMGKVVRTGMKYGWHQPATRLLMLQSFLVAGFFAWAWYAWPPYFLALYGRDAVWLAGVIAALFSLAGVAGNFLAARIAKAGRRRTTILISSCALLTLTMIGTGAIRSFWITVPIFLIGAIAFGVLEPVRQTYLHRSIPSSERATLISMDSLMGNLGGVGGQAGLGYLSQVRSVPAAFLFGGLTTLLALPILARLRMLKSDADVIEDAKVPSPRAGRGLG